MALHSPLHILIVEDTPADVRWIRLILDELNLICTLSVVEDGEHAVNFILKRNQYSSAPDPDIIFLDINLPKVNGMEVLEAIQGDKQHPVCILTSSIVEREVVLERFKLHFHCYILKPADREQILKAFQCFDRLKPIARSILDLPREL